MVSCECGCGCWCPAGVTGGRWGGFGRGRGMGCRGRVLARGGWVVSVVRVRVARVGVWVLVGGVVMGGWGVVGARWCGRMR